MMLHDGGGGTSSPPPITSNVTVDPGEIRQFAKFLDEMETELRAIRQPLVDNVEVPERAFGVYQTSQRAARKHRGVLEAEAENLRLLVQRLSEIATGTNELARLYHDLNELNQASGAAVSTHLKTTSTSGGQ